MLFLIICCVLIFFFLNADLAAITVQAYWHTTLKLLCMFSISLHIFVLIILLSV